MTREEAERLIYPKIYGVEKRKEFLDALEALGMITFDSPPSMIWAAMYDIRYDEEVARQLNETQHGVQHALAKGWLRKITLEEAAKMRQYEP